MDGYCQNCHQQNAPDALICGQCASPLPLNQARGQIVFKTGRILIAAYALMGIYCLLFPVLILVLTILWSGKKAGQESLATQLMWSVITMLPLILGAYY